MKCVILTAGHATKLEAEIRAEQSGEFAHLSNKPKALLPGPDGRPLLDYWWEALTQTRKQFSDIFLVTVSLCMRCNCNCLRSPRSPG